MMKVFFALMLGCLLCISAQAKRNKNVGYDAFADVSEDDDCARVLSADKADYDLDIPPLPKSPEVETKFLANAELIQSMKDLEGKEIQVFNPLSGKNITYVAKFDIEHVYIDTYLDSFKHSSPDRQFQLLKARRLLRIRERQDKYRKDMLYAFRYIGIQSKGGSSETLQPGSEADYFRSEIRGKKYNNKENFMRRLAKLLKLNSDDRAVKNAREMIGFSGNFVPVLEATQHRYFMKLSKKGNQDPSTPDIYLSLDQVDYRGLVGRLGQSQHFFVELEIMGDLSKDSGSTSANKINIWKQISSYVQQTYRLAPAPDDKFAVGMYENVVDP